MSVADLALAPNTVVDIALGDAEFKANAHRHMADWGRRPPFYVLRKGAPPQVIVGRYADAPRGVSGPPPPVGRRPLVRRPAGVLRHADLPLGDAEGSRLGAIPQVHGRAVRDPDGCRAASPHSPAVDAGFWIAAGRARAGGAPHD